MPAGGRGGEERRRVVGQAAAHRRQPHRQRGQGGVQSGGTDVHDGVAVGLPGEVLLDLLGETGDPAVPATALLRAMGIEPGRNDESVTSPLVQDELAALRARYLGEA